jgi:metallo-beta-lactamase class B
MLQSLCARILLTGLIGALVVPMPPSHADGESSRRSEWVNTCTDWDDWDKPGPPFRIHGDTWYVGTCGIAAILITGDDGHILIDGGTAAAAGSIAANIEALAFRVEDVKVLLQSHEHFDHVGGLAELQRRSGARLIASPAAAPVMASGKASADDPQFGMHAPFPAARVDAVLDGSLTVRLGALELQAIATPGHTPGALSWQWRSCDADGCASIVYADSLSPISSDNYRFSDHPEYVAAFRAGLERLSGADCTILLTPHPSASALRDRLAPDAGLVDTAACRNYAAAVSARLDARLAEESAGG